MIACIVSGRNWSYGDVREDRSGRTRKINRRIAGRRGNKTVGGSSRRFPKKCGVAARYPARNQPATLTMTVANAPATQIANIKTTAANSPLQ